MVIDAGSTGSRVHVFAFQTVDDGLKLLEDTFEATKPGLSAKAEDPKGAADSLRRLMDVAVKTVPESARATTSAEIRATAGLRLLPGDASKNILAECVKMLGDYPFKFDPAASVSIMDGADEGAFQWLTMNYLLGNLKGAGLTTTAIFTPCGGGFGRRFGATRVSSRERARGERAGWLRHKTQSARTLIRRVHALAPRSRIDGGARAVLRLSKKASRRACISVTTTCTSTPARSIGRRLRRMGAITMLASPPPPSRSGWTRTATARRTSARLTARGRHAGLGSKRVYLSSYLWDRAVNVGIVSDVEIDGRSSVSEFKNAAEKACGVPLSSVRTEYHGVEEKDARTCAWISHLRTPCSRRVRATRVGGFHARETDRVRR